MDLNVFFVPSYIPFLNPIEELFAFFKYKIRLIDKKNRA